MMLVFLIVLYTRTKEYDEGTLGLNVKHGILRVLPAVCHCSSTSFHATYRPVDKTADV